MQKLNVPLGSYHIIDGEKVSGRYSGQEWTCARCHQLKSSCPGAAVARDCTADRALLSSHMVDHWARIGYKPDTDTMNDVDEAVELGIQVGGSKNKNDDDFPESTLISKYNSVIVGGFKLETALDTIKEVLIENGLPKDHLDEDITRNTKTGSLTVNNLTPEQCLILNAMHKKRFLGRQVYVTSVVGQSPAKAATAPVNPTLSLGMPGLVPEATEPPPSPASGVNMHLTSIQKAPIPKVSIASPSPDPLQGFVFGLVSPGVQDKIDHIEGLKRKSEGSPDADALTRKEKKILREEEKKKKKLEKKQEDKKSLQEEMSSS